MTYDTLTNLQDDIKELKRDIEKLRQHNTTLVTWVANALNLDEVSIFETIIIFDLSKEDLKQKCEQVLSDAQEVRKGKLD